MSESHEPTVLRGKLSLGKNCLVGRNVVVNVAEECVIGNRCVISDNAHLEGRRVEIGDDAYLYTWEWRRLDVGRGRVDEEEAVFKVGKRSTLHNNKIDLCRPVTFGDDVGLSPDTDVYTHYYWGSPLEGFPRKYEGVTLCDNVIVGAKSVLLPGAFVASDVVIGAGSVVSGSLMPHAVYGGVPAKIVRDLHEPPPVQRLDFSRSIAESYRKSCLYRNLDRQWCDSIRTDWTTIVCRYCSIDMLNKTLHGSENEYTDDLRTFLFKNGVRVYTERRFAALPRNHS